ncbi:MAG: DUF58 domain-containing protein [Dehalococcoidia bacterium]|nr:DUF58 domain-containing protein [Dehalococcoidia bacterium]
MKNALRIYPLVALLIATCLVPLPHAGIAAALLAAGAYLFIVRHPHWEIPLALAQLLVLPLLYEPLLHLLSPLMAVPLLPLMGCVLRENALRQPLLHPTKRRELTPVARSVLAALAAAILVSLLLGNHVLTITGGAALLFIIAAAIRTLRRLSPPPLKAAQKEARVVARSTGNLTVELTSAAKMPLHVALKSRYPWIYPDRTRFSNLSGGVKLELTFTPSLSGPSEPGFDACFTDAWGLLQMRQVLNPISLYVVPRARYAEWLARKYLEETAAEAGVTAPRFSPVATGMGHRGGVEYCNSRAYLPGDRLKDMDWKHTARTGEFVVKEFEEQSRKMAIIAVNLAVADAEEADDLVYNLTVSALTLAEEIIPCAVAAYSGEAVLAATPFLDARELVKEALRLGREVVLVAPLERYLQPPDMRQLRVSLRRLQGVDLEPARRLRRLLEVEKRAIDEGSRTHPAREALTRVAARASLPARIVVISAWNHDSEALSLALGELGKRGYSTEIMKLKSKGHEARKAGLPAVRAGA